MVKDFIAIIVIFITGLIFPALIALSPEPITVIIFIISLLFTFLIIFIFIIKKSEVKFCEKKIVLSSFSFYISHNATIFYTNVVLNSSYVSEASIQRFFSLGYRNLVILFLLGLWILSLLKDNINRKDIVCDAFKIIFFLIVPIFIPVEFISVKAAYIFNSFIPLGIFFIIIKNIESPNVGRGMEYNNIIIIIFAIFLSTVVVGVILYSTNWYGFNFAIGQEAKGYGLVNGVPRNWWFYFENNLYLRFPSTFEDPILLGYISAFMSLIAFSYKKIIFYFVFLAICISTLSKGAIVLSLGSFIVGALNLRLDTNFRAAFFLFFILTVYVSSALGLFGPSTSADVHFLGLSLPFVDAVNWDPFQLLWGNGIGSGGNLYKAKLGSEIEYLRWLGTGAESGIGTIFYQAGLSGLLIVLYYWKKIYKKFRSPLCSSALLIYLANMVLQENLVNMNYLFLLLVFIFFANRSGINLKYRRDG